MKNALMLMLALAPAIASANARTDMADIDSKLDRCMQSEDGQSNAGMKMCMGTALDSADKILNRNYKGYTAQLAKRSGDETQDKNQKEISRRLVAAQRAWITFRDANSSLSGTTMLGGSGESLQVVSKLYDMTKARVIELEGFFE